MSDAEPTLIFETVHGSRAYGLARAGSDTDLKGVIVGPAAWYHGFIAAPEQLELSPDHVRFELRKLMRLAAAANPTVLEVLFTEAEDHRTVTVAGQRLLDARERFLSRRVADTFTGYASGQLRRIRGHRQRLQAEGAVPATRNRARAELETRHGYDTKHAMHLLRLQRMAVEILEHGEVRVRRPDREELLAVLDGALSFDALVEESAALATAAQAHRASSPLPEQADEQALNRLCAEIIEEVLHARS
ncbi:MAG: nucleotidyltransferase domain-containing protein [Myxococcales bacterium]|nr:nucleotidyltransferase domain-containing protein [Myxococcales bacterium]